MSLEIYENYNIILNRDFHIVGINFIKYGRIKKKYGISKIRINIDFDYLTYKHYIRKILICKNENISNLPIEIKKECREIFVKYNKLDFVGNLFCNDVFDIIISYLII